jgi:hypothetical protein
MGTEMSGNTLYTLQTTNMSNTIAMYRTAVDISVRETWLDFFAVKELWTKICRINESPLTINTEQLICPVKAIWSLPLHINPGFPSYDRMNELLQWPVEGNVPTSNDCEWGHEKAVSLIGHEATAVSQYLDVTGLAQILCIYVAILTITQFT